MNLSEMETFVRNQADTDTDDAPSATLQVYARAAYRDIQARVYPWPDKRVSYTVTTVGAVADYDVSGLVGGTDMDFVQSVRSSTDVLIAVSASRFRDLSTGYAGSGTPTVYTVESGVLKFWPTPNGAETYTVEGFRTFASWPSGSDEPDLPRGFDEAICWYMLSKYYMAQEDLELAQMYMREFDAVTNQQIEAALRTSAQSAGPMIFGGDPKLSNGMSYRDWVRRSVEG